MIYAVFLCNAYHPLFLEVGLSAMVVMAAKVQTIINGVCFFFIFWVAVLRRFNRRRVLAPWCGRKITWCRSLTKNHHQNTVANFYLSTNKIMLWWEYRQEYQPYCTAPQVAQLSAICMGWLHFRSTVWRIRIGHSPEHPSSPDPMNPPGKWHHQNCTYTYLTSTPPQTIFPQCSDGKVIREFSGIVLYAISHLCNA